MLRRPDYPPLSARHKRVFLAAGFLTVSSIALCAFARMALIRWWLAECADVTPACNVAEMAFEWWWVVMLASVVSIGLVSHVLTKDRLTAQRPSTG